MVYYCILLPVLSIVHYNVSFASFVMQAKYKSVCEGSSVRVVTPDWIIHCVEAMSRIDEVRYHPRLLLTVSQEFVPQASSMTSPVQYLSHHTRQPDVIELSSPSIVSDSAPHARPCVVTATEKSISAVPVSVIPTTVMSQHHVRTHLKSIGNGSELTEVSQSPLKPFGSTKVCISLC